MDSCSQVSLVTQSLCTRLGLARSDTHVSIQGVGDKGALISKKLANFTVKTHFESSFRLDVQALVLPKLSSYKPPTLNGKNEFNHFKGLKLADPAYIENACVEVLLGANVYAEIIQEGIIKGLVNQPIALTSKLGWLITGSISSTKPEVANQVTEVKRSVLYCGCETEETLVSHTC